jgi:hypothetical protein
MKEYTSKIALEYSNTKLSRTKKQNLIDAVQFLRTELNNLQAGNNPDALMITVAELEDQNARLTVSMTQAQDAILEYKNRIAQMEPVIVKLKAKDKRKEISLNWWQKLLN